MSTTASPPRAARRRACSTACSTAWPCASAECANVTRGDGRHGTALPLGDLLGAHAREHDGDLEAAARQRAGDPAQRLALARAGRADDGRARALARAARPRRWPCSVVVVGGQRQRLGREARGQVLVARALGDLVGGRAVDGLDAHERRVALGAPRRAHRAETTSPVTSSQRRTWAARRRRPRRRARAGVTRTKPDPLPSSSTVPSTTRSSRPAGASASASASVSTSSSRSALAPRRAARCAGVRARPRPPAPPPPGAVLTAPRARRGRQRAPRPRRPLLLLLLLLPPPWVPPPPCDDDRVDQLGLAQPAKAVEPELGGDGVEIGERAGLERGAVEHGHAGSFRLDVRLAPGRVATAAGDVCLEVRGWPGEP